MIAVIPTRMAEYGIAHASCNEIDRHLAVEAPVALEYNGVTHAVMMATPDHLEEFAVGFSLCEGFIDEPGELREVFISEAEQGWILRITLDADLARPLLDRVRMRVSEGGCGLCGLESIEQALRPLPQVRMKFHAGRDAICRALGELPMQQQMGRLTGAMHAAAFCTPEGAIVRAMEDVGRHNALDKLIGSLAIDAIDPAGGFILVSARCSYELVEKTVRAGCPMLVTVSAPTSLAVDRAKASGLTLVALARSDTALVLNDPNGRLQ